MIARRNALRLGVAASAVALSGRSTARAADALTIEPAGVKIDKLEVAGPMKIDGNNTLEFGAGVSGKNVDAGKIGYQTFTTDALDIVGAGTDGTNRKIKFWAEGGATLAGSLTVSSDATFQKSLTVSGDATHRDNLTVSGDATLKKSLTVSGPMKIDGNNTLEFGAGVSGKNVDAGKIGYQTFTTDALDIVGAGTDGTNRKIKFWAEGGATLYGSLSIANNLSVPGGVEPLRMLRGIITSNGTKYAGDGFTVQPVGQNRGLYDITFIPAFPSVPGASATQIYGLLDYGNRTGNNEGGDTRDNAVIAQLSADRMRVRTGGANGSESPRAFSFIVIGPR